MDIVDEINIQTLLKLEKSFNSSQSTSTLPSMNLDFQKNFRLLMYHHAKMKVLPLHR